MWKKIFISMLVFIISVGCGTQNDISVTATSIPTSTSTQQILKPTSTNIPTKTPTLTPVATLSPEDALETFKNLVEEDNECKLPCWLEINIDETKFNEVPNKLLIFNSITLSEFSRKGAYIRFFFPSIENTIHYTSTQVYLGGSGGISEIIVRANMYSSRNYSDSSYQNLWRGYLISGLFKSYSQPEKIFLDTTLTSGDPTTEYPFVIWVVYPQQGFLVRYDGVNIRSGEKIIICPMQSGIEITIWNPEKSNYEKYIKDDSALAKPFALGPQPIENVTEFSIESFYETFKDAQINSCFNTPASIWPPN